MILWLWPMPAISMRKLGFRSRRRLSTPGTPSARISGRIGVAHEIDNSPGACSRAVFKIRKRRRSWVAIPTTRQDRADPSRSGKDRGMIPRQAYGLHSYVFWEQKRAQVGLYSMNGKKGFSGCPRIKKGIRSGRPLRPLSPHEERWQRGVPGNPQPFGWFYRRSLNKNRPGHTCLKQPARAGSAALGSGV